MRGLFGSLVDGAGVMAAQTLTELPDFLMWPAANSGQTVNWQTALQVTTVLSCCRVLAEGVAQVPWKLYRSRKGTNGSDVASDHPLHDLLYRRPNGWQTSFEFRETAMLHLVLCGNFFAYKSTTTTGDVLELIPLEPGAVEVKRASDLTLTYTVTGSDGLRRTFPASMIWHVRGPSWNSWMGMETVRLAREAIGLSLALEEAHARLHANGVQPSGIVSVEGTLTDPQHKQMTAWIKAQASGAKKGDLLVLDRAAKWLSQQMSGVDAQHVETRRLQVEEACRPFRVMPIMVGAADKVATYASSEQMFLAHVVHTLSPWAERWDQSADVNLLSDRDRRAGLYVKLNLNGLMRGAAKDRSEYFAKALGSGGSRPWMTQDEIRDLEELNPMGGPAAELREPTNAVRPEPTPAS